MDLGSSPSDYLVDKVRHSKMARFYDRCRQRLIYVRQEASADFWDKQWQEHRMADVIRSVSPRNRYLRIMKRFVSCSDGPILEGGCGLGQFVSAFSRAGYQCVGCDFASGTIKRIRQIAPELDVREADVRDLPFADSTFAAYWSFGVIEHFWEGYESILEEMYRVVKPGGYVFATFPFMSPLRWQKARLGLYKPYVDSVAPEGFYQFALNPQTVLEDFARAGFQHVLQLSLSGNHGLKEEIPITRPIIEWLQRHRHNHLICRVLDAALTFSFNPFSGHIRLCVFRKHPIAALVAA